MIPVVTYPAPGLYHLSFISSEQNKHLTMTEVNQWQPLLHPGGSIKCPNQRGENYEALWKALKILTPTYLYKEPLLNKSYKIQGMIHAWPCNFLIMK